MADLRNRLRDLGVPDDVPVQGGNDVEIRDDGNGVLYILIGSGNDCYLSFHDLAIVFPFNGDRFYSLWVEVDDNDDDFLQGWELPEHEADQLRPLFQNCFPNLEYVSLYGRIDDETCTYLIQSLPERVVSLRLARTYAVMMPPTVLSTISARFPGLEFLDFSDIWFGVPDPSTVTAPFFESVKKLIDELPNLQDVVLDQVESTKPEDWSLVTEAILAHPNLKKLNFCADRGFDGFDKTTESAIVCHLGENRMKAMLRPADNTTFDLRRWVVTAAAFRNQSCVDYLFTPEAVDPCVLAQAALEQLRFRAATKKYLEYELGKTRAKLAQTQEPPSSWMFFETILVAKLNALEESGSQASASVSPTTEDLQRLERAQVFEYEAAD